jgi:cellulose biosynthesis protein BcsQ
LALRAAREILVPVGSDFLGLAGAESLRAAVSASGMKQSWDERFLGILPTFYEPGTPSSTQFEALLAGRFPQQALDLRIRNCDALRLAAALRGSVYDADPLSRGAHDYAELAELLSPCGVR